MHHREELVSDGLYLSDDELPIGIILACQEVANEMN